MIFSIVELNTSQRVQLTLDSKIKNIETHYNVILHNQNITADATYESTIDMPRVIEILSIANTT